MLKVHCPGCGEQIEVSVYVDNVGLAAEWLTVNWRPSAHYHLCRFPDPTQDAPSPGNAVRGSL